MKNTFIDRVLSAFVASLAAALTAGVVVFASGVIPILWFGCFIGLMAVIGFVFPEKSAEVFGFLWGTSTTLSDREKTAIIFLIAGAAWLYICIYFMNKRP